jgi:hypothetical protein
VTPNEYRALQRLADVPRGMAKTLIQAYGFTQRAQTIATCAVSPMNRMARALVDGRCFAPAGSWGSDPRPLGLAMGGRPDRTFGERPRPSRIANLP